MGVKGAPGYLLAAGDGDSHGKAAGVTGGFRLPAQRLGDHLPGHMVDGGLPNRLVQPGLRHLAHPAPPVMRISGVPGSSVTVAVTGRPVVTSTSSPPVLFNGAFRTLGNGAAEQGGNLYHNAFRRAQGDGFRCCAGQQQPGGPGSGQRRTGAGSVPATQQLLPAAHIVLKLGLFRLGGPKTALYCSSVRP